MHAVIYILTLLGAFAAGGLEMKLYKQMETSLDGQRLPKTTVDTALRNVVRVYEQEHPGDPLPGKYKRLQPIKFIFIIALVAEVLILQR